MSERAGLKEVKMAVFFLPGLCVGFGPSGLPDPSLVVTELGSVRGVVQPELGVRMFRGIP